MRKLWLIFIVACALPAYPACASDHLDTPTVIADPAADIADLFAWTSADGRRLNLVMTIVAHQFSDKLQYVFHVDSGARFGKTTAATTILCRFDTAGNAECWAGDADHLRGNASKPAGLEGEKHRIRVFAGLRDDPFFNNVKGTRAALNVAAAALQHGTPVDEAGCPSFDEATSRAILDEWRHTNGGPASNFLNGWKSSALVVSIDLDAINRGGKLLAIWAAVHKVPVHATTQAKAAQPQLGEQIERVGRPLIGNALIGPLAPGDVSDRRKETYNRAAPSDWPQFVPDFERTLGLYDGFDGGFDGKCGNQWFADATAGSKTPYHALATTLADDRLWVNSKSTVCRQFFGVELAEAGDVAELAVSGSPNGDCGGRTPNYDVDVLRSLLAAGMTFGITDGVDRDDKVHSTTVFPFLAAP